MLVFFAVVVIAAVNAWRTLWHFERANKILSVSADSLQLVLSLRNESELSENHRQSIERCRKLLSELGEQTKDE